MKYHFSCIMLFGCLLAAAATAQAATPITGTVRVREDQILRRADPEVLGSCYEWGDYNSETMESTSSLEFSEEFKKTVKQIKKFPLSRTAGGSVNHFFWKNNIGAYSERQTPGKMWCYNRPQNFGPAEWVKQGEMIDPDCRYVVGINILTEEPWLNGQYAEYMTGDPEVSELAALRADAGLPDPVDVYAYELGNELDYTLSAEDYVKRAKASIREIKKVDPDAKFMACGISYPVRFGNGGTLYAEEWRKWHKTILREIGDEIDYISYHMYYGWSVSGQKEYIDMITNDIREITGDDRIKIVITEQAVWTEVVGENNESNTLKGCLSTADFVQRMYGSDNVSGANYFAFPGLGRLNDSLWAYMGKGMNEEAWYLSGIGKMYNDFLENLGTTVIKSELALSTSTDAVTAVATANNGDELILSLNNKYPDFDCTLNFEFQNDYTLVSETIFTGENEKARVWGKDTEHALDSVVYEKNEPHFNRYELKNNRLVFLKLKRTTPLEQKPGKVISDLMDYPAQNDYLNGPGQVVGNWKTSAVYPSWNNRIQVRPTVYQGKSALEIIGGANPGCTACVNYIGDTKEISARQAVTADLVESYYNYNLGLRTMVHDGEKSYYELNLSPDFYHAEFRKVQNGEVVYEKTITPPRPRRHDAIMTMIIDGNRISYGISSEGKNLFLETYYDDAPYAYALSDAGISLNAAGEGGSVYLKEFTVTDLNAENTLEYQKRKGAQEEYISGISTLLAQYQNASPSEKLSSVLALQEILPESAYQLLCHMTEEQQTRLSQKLSTYSGFAIREVSVDEFLENLNAEIQTTLFEEITTGEQVQKFIGINGGALKLSLVKLQANPTLIANGLCQKKFENVRDLHKQLCKWSVLAILKNNPTPETVCDEIYNWAAWLDVDPALWYRFVEKKSAAEALITAAAAMSSPEEIGAWLSAYDPGEESSIVYMEDFQNCEIMSEPLVGTGQTIGTMQSSYTFYGWEAKNTAQVIADPQNANNHVLKLMGWGAVGGYPITMDITSDISALGKNQQMDLDVYKPADSTVRFGVRMMANRYEYDYYELSFMENNQKPILQQVIDGKTVKSVSLSGRIAVGAWYHVTMTVCGDSVSCTVSDRAGAVVSEAILWGFEPFKYSPEDCKAKLMIQGHGTEVYFDNVVLSQYQGDSRLLADLAYRAEIDTVRNAKTAVDLLVDGDPETIYSSGGSYVLVDFGVEYPISAIRFTNLTIGGNLTIRGYDKNKKNGKTIQEFRQTDIKGGGVGVWMNDQPTFRYLQINSTQPYSIGNLEVFTDVDGKTLSWNANEDLRLMIYQNGEKVAASELSCTGNPIVCTDNEIMTVKEGESILSAGLTGFTLNTVGCTQTISGNKVTFTVGTGKKSERFLVACYDAENRLISVKTLSGSAKNQNARTQKLSYTLPDGCKTYSLMHWNDQTLAPQSEAYQFTYGG